MVRRLHRGRLAAAALAAMTGWAGQPLVRTAAARDDASASAAERGGPQIRIDQIRWSDEHATAPLESGGLAELTLDHGLQSSADHLLRAAHPIAGSVLLTDAKSGRILVWKEYRRSGSSQSVVLEPAPTASLFKLVTTTAIYERTRIVPKTRVCFDGGESVIERRHLEPPPRFTGRCAPFWQALGYSRNAVFAQLATHYLSRSDLQEVAHAIGFNGDVPFDAPATFGSVEFPYGDLEFARTAAGFANSAITPLGAHWLTYAIATEGMAPRLTMVQRAGDYRAPGRRVLVRRLLGATTAYRLVRAMEVTVHSGTSLDAFTAPTGSSYLGSIRVAGKTGTLQPTPKAPTTSWFTGFAPSRKPRVIVTVLLQNSKVWRRKANEVARDVLRTYFAGAPGVTDPFTDE